MTRTRVYVDGFNLYYGALKGTRYKWLDPVRLSARLLPRECANWSKAPRLLSTILQTLLSQGFDADQPKQTPAIPKDVSRHRSRTGHPLLRGTSEVEIVNTLSETARPPVQSRVS